eukprot:gene1397-820_t
MIHSSEHREDLLIERAMLLLLLFFKTRFINLFMKKFFVSSVENQIYCKEFWAFPFTKNNKRNTDRILTTTKRRASISKLPREQRDNVALEMDSDSTERCYLQVSCESIDFGVVAVNEIPSYRQVTFKNTHTLMGITVFVSCSSHLINIQRFNENYAMVQKGSSSLLRSYNSLFDTVGIVSSLDLSPGQEIELISWFRADSSTFGHLVAQDSPVKIAPSFRVAYQVKTESGVLSEKKTKKPTEFTINCSAMVFLSQLEISSTLLQCTIAPNKTQLMNFSVTNISTEPLSFMIRNLTLPIKGLTLGVYDSNDFDDPKQGHRLRLDGKGSVSLCLLVQTDGNVSPSHYQEILQCDNIRDSRNSVQLQVSINVSSDFESGDIVSISNNKLNFGDVYRGVSTTREVEFINLDNREDVTIRLLPDDIGSRHLGSKIGEKGGPVTLLKDGIETEEVILSSQSKKLSVTIQYRPSVETSLSQLKFPLNFAVTTGGSRYQRLQIFCQAKLFTSSIKVSQRDINFGDCIVGQSKRITFYMENLSPLPGCFTVELRSKIITIEGRQEREACPRNREIRETFTIAPMTKLPITLRIAPQRVNPTYRKELTIFNSSNPTADRQIVNIEANNMAPSDAKAHNELYGWECCLEGYDNEGSGLSRINNEPTKLCAIAGVPLIIPYLARSKVETPLELQVQSTCEEISVFYLSDPVKAEQVESLGSQLRGYCGYDEVEEGTRGPKSSFFSAPENLQSIIDELHHLLTKHGKERKVFKLEGMSVLKIFVKICRTTQSTEIFTKEDGLSVAVEGADIPSRFVRLSYRLCGSQFQVSGQLVKNFGEVNIGTKKSTKISVVNRCRSVLYIRMLKSHSATAGHIRIFNSEKQEIVLGVRPYATKEIELTFSPGIKGNFEEKIVITNILCPQNSFTMTLKASVMKADTFEVSPDSWIFESFEVPLINDPPYRMGARFTASNTSKTTRQIRLRLFPHRGSGTSRGVTQTPCPEGEEEGSGKGPGGAEREVDFSPLGSNPSTNFLDFRGVVVELQLMMESIGASSGSSRRVEEEIEKLDQKIKIYKRKNKAEKLAAAIQRRALLQRQLTGVDFDLTPPEVSDSDYALSESEDDHGQNTDAVRPRTLVYGHSELLPVLLGEGVSLPPLQAGESASVMLRFACSRSPGECLPEFQRATLNFIFYEELDKEVCRIVPVSISVQRQESESSSPSSRQVVEDVGALGNTIITGGSSGAVPSIAPSSSIGISLRDVSDGSTLASPSSSLTFMDHPLLVLRNCVVNEGVEFSFSLSATGCSTTFVVLESRPCRRPLGDLEAKFYVRPHSGELPLGTSVKVAVTCTPQRAGPQKYFIPIMNAQQSSSSQDIKYLVVAMNPTPEEAPISLEPEKLVFPPAITPYMPLSDSTLTIKSARGASNLHHDPTSVAGLAGSEEIAQSRSGNARRTPQELSIRTRFPRSHLLRVRTNRPAQVKIYEDRGCTIPLENVLARVFAKDVIRVYVVFTPSPKAIHTTPRSFRAGIVIEALTISEREGTGVQVVSSAVAEVMPTTSIIPTSITLRNPSPQFAIQVILRSSVSQLLEVSDRPIFSSISKNERKGKRPGIKRRSPRSQEGEGGFGGREDSGTLTPFFATTTATRGSRGDGFYFTPDSSVRRREDRDAPENRPGNELYGGRYRSQNAVNRVSRGGGEHPSQDAFVPSPVGGEGSSCWCLPPLTAATFDLKLHLPSVGLVEEHLIVQNRSCAQPPICIPVSGLRQDPCILAPLLSPSGLALPPAVVVWVEEAASEAVSQASHHHGGGSFQLLQPVSTTLVIQHTGKREALLIAEVEPQKLPLYFGDLPGGPSMGGMRIATPGSLPHHNSGGQHYPMSPTKAPGRILSTHFPSSPPGSPTAAGGGAGWPAASASVSFPSSPLSNTPSSFHRDPSPGSPTALHQRASMWRRGVNVVTVPAKTTVHIPWTLTDLPPFSSEQLTALQAHQSVTINATAKVFLAHVGVEASPPSKSSEGSGRSRVQSAQTTPAPQDTVGGPRSHRGTPIPAPPEVENKGGNRSGRAPRNSHHSTTTTVPSVEGSTAFPRLHHSHPTAEQNDLERRPGGADIWSHSGLGPVPARHVREGEDSCFAALQGTSLHVPAPPNLVLGPCIAVVPISMTFGQSEGRALQTSIDLGMVTEKAVTQHSTGSDASCRGGGWSSSPLHAAAQLSRTTIRFELQNLSSHLSLPLTVQCPPVIRFSSEHWTVPPGGVLKVEGQLQLSLIDSQGAFNYPVYFVNAWNPGNDICVRVSGQYYRKFFELECGGTAVGESLHLPTLRLDPSNTTPAILAEVKLGVLTTDPETILEVSLRINERCKGLMELQLVHYDDTTTPVTSISFRGEKPREVTPSSGLVDGSGSNNNTEEAGTQVPTTGLTAAESRTGGNSNSKKMVTDRAGRGGGVGGPPTEVSGPSSFHTGPGEAAGLSGNPAHHHGKHTAGGGEGGGGEGGAGGIPPAHHPILSNSGTGTGGGAAGGSGARMQYRKMARLRCVLLDSNRLDALFDAFVRRREDPDARMQQWTVESMWQHSVERRRLIEVPIEKLWLGSIIFHNAWTEDVEVHVSSTIEPFVTFSVSPRLQLKPKRPPPVSSGGGSWDRYRTSRRGGGSAAVTTGWEMEGLSSLVREAASFLCLEGFGKSTEGGPSGAPESGEKPDKPQGREEEMRIAPLFPPLVSADCAVTPQMLRNIEYVGNLVVTNMCESYMTDLRLVVLLRDEAAGSQTSAGASGSSHPPLFLEATTTTRSTRGPQREGPRTTTTETLVRHALLFDRTVLRSTVTSPTISSSSAGGAGGGEGVDRVVSLISKNTAGGGGTVRSLTSASLPRRTYGSATSDPGAAVGEQGPLQQHHHSHSQHIPCTSNGALSIMDFSVPPNSRQTLKIRILPLPALMHADQRRTAGGSSRHPTHNIPTLSTSFLMNWLERSMLFVVMDKRVACSMSVSGINVAPFEEEDSDIDDNEEMDENDRLDENESVGDKAGEELLALSAEPASVSSGTGANDRAVTPPTGHDAGSDGPEAASAAPSTSSPHLRGVSEESGPEVQTHTSQPFVPAEEDENGTRLLPPPLEEGVGAAKRSRRSTSSQVEERRGKPAPGPPPSEGMTGPPAGDALLPDRPILTLRHCQHVALAAGHWASEAEVELEEELEEDPRGTAFQAKFVFSKDEPQTTEITVRNTLQDREVGYKVSVLSQSPQKWFIVTENGGVLRPGESKLLGVHMGPTEVGSFAGYLLLTNNVRPAEVVYLRLKAEVFERTPRDDLFELLASDGTSLMYQPYTSGAHHHRHHRHLVAGDGSAGGEGVLQGAGAGPGGESSATASGTSGGGAAGTTPASLPGEVGSVGGPSPPQVQLGYLYGEGATQACVAMEIVNKSAVALEFPISVVMPFHMEVKPMAEEEEACGEWHRVTDRKQRRRRRRALPQAPPGGRGREEGEGKSIVDAGGGPRTELEAKSSGTRTPLPEAEDKRERGGQSNQEVPRPPPPDQGSGSPGGAGMFPTASNASLPQVISSEDATALLLPPFEGTLITCHLHAVQARIGQKTIVVDPQSRVRLAVVLQTTCLRLPQPGMGRQRGYLVEGSADVMVRCRQVRDSQVPFRVHFCAAPATFDVPSVVEMPHEWASLDPPSPPPPHRPPPDGTVEEAEGTAGSGNAARGEGPASGRALGELTLTQRRPVPTEAVLDGMSMVRLPVRNLRPCEEAYVFHTQSLVLHVEAGGAGSTAVVPSGETAAGVGVSEESIRAGSTRGYRPPHLGPDGHLNHRCTLHLPGMGTGYFLVWLDRERAASLLRCDERGLPALVEYASVRRVYNPTERIYVEFHLKPPQLSRDPVGGVDVWKAAPPLRQLSPQSPGALGLTSADPAPSPTPPASLTAAPAQEPQRRGSSAPRMGAGGDRRLVDPSLSARMVSQQVNDACLLGFAVEFTSTLRRYQDRLLRLFHLHRSARAGRGEGGEEEEEDPHPHPNSGAAAVRRHRCQKITVRGAGRKGRRGEQGGRCGKVDAPTTPARTQDSRRECSDTIDAHEKGCGYSTSSASVSTAVTPPSLSSNNRGGGGSPPCSDTGSASTGTTLDDTTSSSRGASRLSFSYSRSGSSRSGCSTTSARHRRASPPDVCQAPEMPCGTSGHSGDRQEAQRLDKADTPPSRTPSEGRRRRRRRRPATGLSHAAWRRLHRLFVELTWIVDELLRFTILLRNSRHVESYCVFITAVVAGGGTPPHHAAELHLNRAVDAARRRTSLSLSSDSPGSEGETGSSTARTGAGGSCRGGRSAAWGRVAPEPARRGGRGARKDDDSPPVDPLVLEVSTVPQVPRDNRCTAVPKAADSLGVETTGVAPHLPPNVSVCVAQPRRVFHWIDCNPRIAALNTLRISKQPKEQYGIHQLEVLQKTLSPNQRTLPRFFTPPPTGKKRDHHKKS